MSGGRSEVGTRRSSSRSSRSVAALAKRQSPLRATQRPRYLGASALSHVYSRDRPPSFLHDGVATGGNNSDRISFLEFLSQKSQQLGEGLNLGAFDRLEMEGEHSRVVAQVRIDRGFFLRTTKGSARKTS